MRQHTQKNCHVDLSNLPPTDGKHFVCAATSKKITHQTNQQRRQQQPPNKKETKATKGHKGKTETKATTKPRRYKNQEEKTRDS